MGEIVNLKQLVDEAAAELGAEVEVDGDFYYLTFATSGEDDDESDDDEGAAECVAVFATDEGDGVFVRDTLGHNQDGIDLADVLRSVSEASYARVYLEEDEDEGGEIFVIESGCLWADALDGEMLAVVCQEVADITGALRGGVVPDDPEGDESGDETSS